MWEGMWRIIVLSWIHYYLAEHSEEEESLAEFLAAGED